MPADGRAELVRAWRMEAATASVLRECADELASYDGSLEELAKRWKAMGERYESEELVDVEYSQWIASNYFRCVIGVLDLERARLTALVSEHGIETEEEGFGRMFTRRAEKAFKRATNIYLNNRLVDGWTREEVADYLSEWVRTILFEHED